MSRMLTPGLPVSATALTLDHTAVPDDQVVSGRPRTGAVVLDTLGGVEVGVWEQTPGAMRDVEEDEIFVVLSGMAVIDFEDEGRSIRVTAGDIVRLTAGSRTVWTVTETLRKVYLA